MAPWLLVTAALALAATPQLSEEKAASAWQKTSVAPRPTVPSIVGLTPEDAALALRRRDLREMPMGNETTSAQPPGRVARQLPPAGDPVPPERTVQFWLAEPPREIQVPNVVGLPFRQAETVLRQARFGCDVAGREPSREIAGTVARQDPPGRAPAPRGSRVRLWLAVPPPPPPPPRLDVPPALLLAGLGLLAAGSFFAVRRLAGRSEARRVALEPPEVEVVPVRDQGEGRVVSSGALLTGFELRAFRDPGNQEIRKDGPLAGEGDPSWNWNG